MTKDKKFKAKINAKGMEITVESIGNDDDYISLTDIAKYKNSEFPADVVKNWLRSRSTIEFLGLWEQLNNHNFKLVEFDQFLLRHLKKYLKAYSLRHLKKYLKAIQIHENIKVIK